MDEEGLAQDVADDARDGLDGVIALAQLDEPRGGAARTCQLELVPAKPDHEQLRLHRAFDSEAIRESHHRRIVRHASRRPAGRSATTSRQAR
jgi:hypothetical protein